MEDRDIEKLRILINQTEELVEIFESLQERAKLQTTDNWAMYREIEMLKEKYDNKLMTLRVDLCTPKISKKKRLSFSQEEGDISGKINISPNLKRKHKKCPIFLDQTPISNVRQKHHQKTRDSP